MGRLLADLQAFMFWKVRIAAPPHRQQDGALAYSSANYAGALVEQQRSKHLLKNNISAVYFSIRRAWTAASTRAYSGGGWAMKRVRLYSTRDEKYVRRRHCRPQAHAPTRQHAVPAERRRHQDHHRAVPDGQLGPHVQGRARHRYQVDLLGRSPLRPGDRAHACARAGRHLAGQRRRRDSPNRH